MVKKVSDLYSEIVEKDIYIVGTGPSFRLYDKSFYSSPSNLTLNLPLTLIRVTIASWIK